jgi:SulP family sulfate permease
VFRIHGPFLFGATDKLEGVLHKLDDLPPIIILKLRYMSAIDATGLQAIEQFADVVHSSGRGLILCGAPPRPAQLMKRAEFEEHLGPANICDNIGDALKRAEHVFRTIYVTADEGSFSL